MKYKLLLLLTCVFYLNMGFAQGKLKKAKENLKTNRNSTYQSSDRGRSSSGSDNIWIDLFIEPIIWFGGSIIIGELEKKYFTPYPYHFSDVNGEYVSSKQDDFYTKSLFKTSLTYLSSKDAIQALNATLQYRFIPELSLEYNHIHFRERYFGDTEYLDMSTVLLNYYRVREKYVTAWWGIGGSYVFNSVNKAGFTYNVGAEVFPIRPFSLIINWKQSLFDFNNINEFKTELNYYKKHWSVYLGYYGYKLAGVDNPSFGGGLRYQF